jgi:hypothetical protein
MVRFAFPLSQQEGWGEVRSVASARSIPLTLIPPDKDRSVMRATFEPLPSPLMGRVRVGVRIVPLAPVPTFPRQGGRGIDLPLSADPLPEGEEIALQTAFQHSDAHPVAARSLPFRTKAARICANARQR